MAKMETPAGVALVTPNVLHQAGRVLRLLSLFGVFLPLY